MTSIYPYCQSVKNVSECAEIFIHTIYEFNKDVGSYINALLNSLGGVIKLGIRFDGFVSGVECTRSREDSIKLTVDNIVKYFSPKVSPSLYRLKFVPCGARDFQTGRTYEMPDRKVVEIHISAGTEILYMDGKLKSMVLHNGRPMVLMPQQIRALAVAKYKQEVLSADTLWDVITPACLKKKESRLKKSTTAMCTQTTPGLAPVVTPKPKPPSSITTELAATSTPFPTPVAELFCTPVNTPKETVVKNTNNKRSLSPDNTGTVVKRMPHRSCKESSVQTNVVETSPDIICISSSKARLDDTICIIDSPSDTPFAAETNGNTVVRRVLRSSKKNTVEASLVKNPSDLFSENSDQERQGRSKTRRRHKAGQHHTKSQSPSKERIRETRSSRERHSKESKRSKSNNTSRIGSDSESPERGQEERTLEANNNEDSPSRDKKKETRSRQRRMSNKRSRIKSDSKSPESRQRRREERARLVAMGTRADEKNKDTPSRKRRKETISSRGRQRESNESNSIGSVGKSPETRQRRKGRTKPVEKGTKANENNNNKKDKGETRSIRETQKNKRSRIGANSKSPETRQRRKSPETRQKRRSPETRQRRKSPETKQRRKSPGTRRQRWQERTRLVEKGTRVDEYNKRGKNCTNSNPPKGTGEDGEGNSNAGPPQKETISTASPDRDDTFVENCTYCNPPKETGEDGEGNSNKGPPQKETKSTASPDIDATSVKNCTNNNSPKDIGKGGEGNSNKRPPQKETISVASSERDGGKCKDATFVENGTSINPPKGTVEKGEGNSNKGPPQKKISIASSERDGGKSRDATFVKDCANSDPPKGAGKDGEVNSNKVPPQKETKSTASSDRYGGKCKDVTFVKPTDVRSKTLDQTKFSAFRPPNLGIQYRLGSSQTIMGDRRPLASIGNQYYPAIWGQRQQGNASFHRYPSHMGIRYPTRHLDNRYPHVGVSSLGWNYDRPYFSNSHYTWRNSNNIRGRNRTSMNEGARFGFAARFPPW